MNTNALAKHYARLTPPERFCLIFAAGARGDDAEQARLVAAGQRITLSMSDHAPWAHAFHELAMTIFLELLEEAAQHRDAFAHWCDAAERRSAGGSAELAPADDLAAAEDAPAPRDGSDCPGIAAADEEGLRLDRARDLYRAQGFILKTKVEGWKLFCERLGIPPFALWQFLPGFDRLHLALELLADNECRPALAFRPGGMLRWLSRIRPKGALEPSRKDLLSSEHFADDLAKVFRQRVAWWGG